ncbi:T9SS type B sorting domain-containing protein [Flavobacterium sedimenticola]|uniref:T9SS type B sorting domain-containing protein n=1 Tax=Flavobacterium sedimenticola TaxID=3043286 RepID=A0ABT6XSC1_9FLAO|nr:T9SS type B sorting domain-containing protein [Flavobacterium sedimenticola]MDI9257872.1 T9SS type B sorting domain-containing protein [Flavobacterium sedimenticola]
MKKSVLIIFLFISSRAFTQQEASVWYFGQNAGLKFQNTGTVTPLSDGQLNTEEGCSSIADANGNVLFYTDGRTVWDRNHIQMPNGSFDLGTELFGDSSSTQSAIIVPKPDDPNIYYIFTVDEPHYQNAAAYPNAFSGTYTELDSGQTPTTDDGKNNGFNYSVVDLSVLGSNGSIGNVISRNNHLITYDTNPNGEEIKYKCAEKITAIKNEGNGSYWVITHFINKFYAFKVTAGGVMTTPVISAVGSNQTLDGYRRNAIGYLKASPDGQKLAIAHQQNGNVVGQAAFSSGSIQLFDFDALTGSVSNPIDVIPNIQAYGIEFSPDSEKLYATYRIGVNQHMELGQFDLLSSNITGSKTVIYNTYNYLFALQLAPNGKIYCATGYLGTIGVINNPDSLGLACNYIHNGQPLAPNKIVKSGLPPFITSFFNTSFTAENFCLGSPTQFTPYNASVITSINWDFGDGSPTSNVMNPTHLYAAPGNYTVTLTATSINGTSSKSKIITIAAVPTIANSIANQSVCGTMNTSYNLSQYNNTLLGNQAATTFGVAYFLSASDADSHINVLPNNYTLSLGATIIYAKVYNLVNTNCFAITNFTLTLFNTPIANTPNNIFVCDDSTNDGVEIFDLQNVKTIVLGNQNPNTYTVNYYSNQNDADTNSNPLPVNYQNTGNPQTLYVRVENNQNSNCFATTSFQIGLFAMPIVAMQPHNLYACDSGSDSAEIFDLNQQTVLVLGSQSLTDFDVTYHTSINDANTGSNAIPLFFANTVSPQTIYIRITNRASSTCFATTSFMLTVNPEPVLNIADSYTICEGHPITVTAPSGFFSYNWTTGSITSSTSIPVAGDYSVTVLKDYGQIQCGTTEDFVVYNSNVATITNIEIGDWTDNQNNITISVTGDGDYEYSLDNITFQDSHFFSGLPAGQYLVYVRDKKGCGTTADEVFLLMYPKYFTPNGDGYHDTWQIKFSFVEPQMELFIFDKYGKLITAFKGTDFGWDGTYNGKEVFADDYWFVVKRQNGKEYKGHFSLLR